MVEAATATALPANTATAAVSRVRGESAVNDSGGWPAARVSGVVAVWRVQGAEVDLMDCFVIASMGPPLR